MSLDKEKIIREIRVEQQIHPLFPNEALENYINEGIQDINNVCGVMVDYDEDLEARSLLKTYVMYANHKRLAEFKAVYVSEYVKLQIKYYSDPDLS